METLSGIHHFYVGIVVMFIGFVLLWASRDWLAVVGIVICILGLITITDDVFQHSMQRFYKDGYASPLKRIYKTCAPACPLIGKIAFFFDKLFLRDYNSKDKVDFN